MSEKHSTKNKKEINDNSGTIFTHPWKIFFWETFLFSLTMALGIFTGLRLGGFLVIKDNLPAIEITPIFPILSDIRLPSGTSSLSLLEFLLYFLFALLFILFIIFVLKSKRSKRIIFKILFILTTGLGGTLALYVWNIGNLTTLVLIAFLIFAWLQIKSILVHNLLLILGMIGLGSAMGLRIEPWTGITILAIFSIYDFIAVYKTKHMVKMAREMITAGAILGLILPQETSGFKTNLREVRPGGKFLILGGGDIVFPLVLAVSLLPSGIINSLIVAIFALFGLFTSFLIFINQKVRRPIPALPPIALFSIIGFLITLVI